VKRLYGVSNGRIMRFPPERSYPAVEDADGNKSHAYVYAQAAAAVQSATGRAVKPEDITLVPIPFGITSERWRAGDRPPYEIWHRFTDATGQQRYEPVLSPNSTMARPWSADPAAATAATTAEREARFRASPIRPVTPAEAPAGQDPQAWSDRENMRRRLMTGDLLPTDPRPPAPGEVRPGYQNPEGVAVPWKPTVDEFRQSMRRNLGLNPDGTSTRSRTRRPE